MTEEPPSAMSSISPQDAPRRVVLYSHDTLGFGHLRRNLMLAERLKAMSPAPEVLLVAGTSEAGAFDLPAGVDLITLPAYAKQPCGTYRARRLSMSLAELRDLRAGIIKAAVKSSAPTCSSPTTSPSAPRANWNPRCAGWRRSRGSPASSACATCWTTAGPSAPSGRATAMSRRSTPSTTMSGSMAIRASATRCPIAACRA
jgi:hypothetical protein